ncbi:lytic transglycosylase domain-containing protein (plasmid) [Mesorhizobium sp. AaZ16]|uniref:lytic transglycosylase domain-containing protein n=1 Tax=Mesorhizobium sp. AaZ16 TaxID=3402289 RepID=UPI00374EA4A8
MAVAGTVTAKPVDDAVAPALAWSCAGKAGDANGFRELATCEAKQLGLPPQFATAVMEIESGFNPGAKGKAGEIGLMQVMPSTARMLGFHGDSDQLADPAINIALGVRYLAEAHRLAGGDLCTSVMKYRAGHRETRFSARSIAYCLQARKIFDRDGHKVTGAVPVATIGLAVASTEPRTDNQVARTGFCIRKIFVPPPVFRKCVEYRKTKHLPRHPKS